MSEQSERTFKRTVIGGFGYRLEETVDNVLYTMAFDTYKEFPRIFIRNGEKDKRIRARMDPYTLEEVLGYIEKCVAAPNGEEMEYVVPNCHPDNGDQEETKTVVGRTAKGRIYIAVTDSIGNAGLPSVRFHFKPQKHHFARMLNGQPMDAGDMSQDSALAFVRCIRAITPLSYTQHSDDVLNPNSDNKPAPGTSASASYQKNNYQSNGGNNNGYQKNNNYQKNNGGNNNYQKKNNYQSNGGYQKNNYQSNGGYQKNNYQSNNGGGNNGGYQKNNYQQSSQSSGGESDF